MLFISNHDFQQIVNLWSLSIQVEVVVVGMSPILLPIHLFLIAEEVFHLASHQSKVKPCIFETAILFQPFEEEYLGTN